MMKISDIILLVDEHRRVSELEDKTLSHRVFGDSKKIKAIRDGADLTTSRFNLAVEWFFENWPKDATWPDCVEKPTQ